MLPPSFGFGLLFVGAVCRAYSSGTLFVRDRWGTLSVGLIPRTAVSVLLRKFLNGSVGLIVGVNIVQSVAGLVWWVYRGAS